MDLECSLVFAGKWRERRWSPQDEETGEETVAHQAVEGIVCVDGQRCKQMDKPDSGKVESHGELGVRFWYEE